MTGSSTTSLGHHIRSKHPRDWARVIEAEKAKAEQDAANKAEAKKLQEEMEGDPDEDDEDLTSATPVPGPSTSRKKAAEDDGGAETPMRITKVTMVSPRRSMFTKVVKHNIKDKRQLQFDLRFARYMVGNNLGMAHAGTEETLEFFGEYLPIYHIKNPSTFTRYFQYTLYFITYVIFVISILKQLYRTFFHNFCIKRNVSYFFQKQNPSALC